MIGEAAAGTARAAVETRRQAASIAGVGGAPCKFQRLEWLSIVEGMREGASTELERLDLRPQGQRPALESEGTLWSLRGCLFESPQRAHP